MVLQNGINYIINVIRCDVYLSSTNNLFPISLIRLFGSIRLIRLITYYSVIIIHIIIFDTCSFGFEKTLFWLAKDALLNSN